MADKTEKELIEEINLLKKNLALLEASDARRQDDDTFSAIETLYREIYEEAPLGYLSLDSEGFVIAVNKAFVDTFGYAREEASGKSFEDFLSAEYREGFKKIFNKLKTTGKIRVEFEMIHKNHERRFVVFDGKMANSPTSMFKQAHCILQDVTERKRLLDALNEKEARYKSLFEFSPVAIFINREDRIVMFNQACLKLFGADKPEQLLRKSHYELFHSDFHVKIIDYIRRYTELAVQIPALEEQIIKLDGTIADVEVIAVPFYDQGINSMHVVLQDITERKKAEVRLERINDCLITLGPDFEKNINTLTALCGELLGADCALYNSLEGNLLCAVGQWQAPKDFNPQDQPQGHICYDIIQQESNRSVTINNLQKTIYASSDPNVAKYGLKTYLGHVVYSAGKPAGSLCVVYTKDVKPTEDDKRIIGILASSIGTEVGRKRAVGTMSVSELKYRRLFETAQDAILILDGETGMVVDVNPFLINMLGYSFEQFKGKAVWELGFLKDAIANKEKFLELKEKGYVRYENLPLETFDGKIRNVEFVSNVYSVDSKKVIQCNIRDITERKKAEEEFASIKTKMESELIKAHKLDSLGVLAGGIAHDFNNILTGILGNISMVRHSIDSSDKNFEVLNDAEKAVFQAKDLTRQLLTFAKGGLPVKKVTLLSDVLMEASIFAARGTKVKCKFNIAPDIRFVHVDPGQISQVVSNIVINAVQSMPEGGEVFVSAQNINLSEDSSIPLKAGEYVRITIKDKGCGIAAENLLKIFDPYFTTKRSGSGLGLATSYSIVKNHEGCITVESELGLGALFHIYLPAFMGKTEAISEELTKGFRMGHGRILIMDDEKIISNVAVKILTKIGYTAEVASDGDQAIDKYRKTFGTKQAFAAVILDLTIPGGKGGKETITALKEINPDIKAVVSSCYSNDPVMANYEFYGFSGILQKPYRIEEISQILDSLLKKDNN